MIEQLNTTKDIELRVSVSDGKLELTNSQSLELGRAIEKWLGSKAAVNNNEVILKLWYKNKKNAVHKIKITKYF